MTPQWCRRDTKQQVQQQLSMFNINPSTICNTYLLKGRVRITIDRYEESKFFQQTNAQIYSNPKFIHCIFKYLFITVSRRSRQD